MQTSASWFLYLIQTEAGMLYTGITTEPKRRLHQHQTGKGAKALRGKGLLTMIYCVAAESRSQASVLEYQVKQLSRVQKLRLVAEQPQSLAEWLSQLGHHR